MWQLNLLSRVIPAFGALAKEFTESEHEDSRLREVAWECYSDIVNIGSALHMSCGEWASGTNDEDITKLLTALETRFPTRMRNFLPASKPYEFPQLNALATYIESLGLDGFAECAVIMDQSMEKREQYLKLIGQGVPLFHNNEKRDPDKRNKFLKRIRTAKNHLLEVYCKVHSGTDLEGLSLSQHPSHGMKEVADRVYNILERHWRCSCSHRAVRPTGVREARLSLIRHRELAAKTSSHISTTTAHLPAKFEVLLPVCKDDARWKVTNVEVKNAASYNTATVSRQAVDNDVCQYLLESDEYLQVDFLIENETFWHLKPKILQGINHYATMEPLRQFLGDGSAASYISNCKPRDQLTLCYILANSMLYLYPSSWFQPEWSSSMVYFVRRSNSSMSPVVTFPYVSVELQKSQIASTSKPYYMQCHSHPAILALGIIFLEIVTGARFKKTREPTPWQQCNKDNHQAVQLLRELERQGQRDLTKRISSSLSKAIRACLTLEPPPNFPTNQLTEEGPIRHYILSCIVHPLAHELQTGYNVCLKDLPNSLDPEKIRNSLDDDGLERISHRSTAVKKAIDVNTKADEVNFIISAQTTFPTDAEAIFAERREACLFRDRDEPIDENKASAATAWLEWHADAQAQITKLRNSNMSDVQRVKIAILDSGIELSQDNEDLYNIEPKIQYKSWIDQDTEWKDDAGHGTHLAILVRKIAPNAIVHVGRVFKKKPNKGSAANVAQAIRYAVDKWEVDIIVMSFGFGEEDEQLYASMQHTASKGVLMFAAASNDGKNRPNGVAWPASDINVICVHSGDGHGTASTFTPDPRDSMRIMVLGECVKSAWPQRLKSPDSHKLMSGTSCAAPIAAGIAALVLDYARGFLTETEWKKLRRVDSMRQVFESMSDKPANGYWWVKHWKWFNSKVSEGWIQGEVKKIIC